MREMWLPHYQNNQGYHHVIFIIIESSVLVCLGAVVVFTGMFVVRFLRFFVSLERGHEALYSGTISSNSTTYSHHDCIFFSQTPFCHFDTCCDTPCRHVAQHNATYFMASSKMNTLFWSPPLFISPVCMHLFSALVKEWFESRQPLWHHNIIHSFIQSFIEALQSSATFLPSCSPPYPVLVSMRSLWPHPSLYFCHFSKFNIKLLLPVHLSFQLPSMYFIILKLPTVSSWRIYEKY